MDGEVGDVPEESGNLVQDDSDFDNGFEGVPTETPVTPEPEEKIEEPKPEFVNITKADFELLMARANEVDHLKTQFPTQVDKAFGKIGNIERILNDMRNPQGQALQLSEDDFAELKGEYPELAELQAKGLQRVLGKLRMPSVDTQAIEKMVGDRANGARSELIDTTLDTIVGGDWVEEFKKPEYAAWMAKQSEEIQALQASPSLRDAAKVARLYRAHKDSPPPKEPPKPTPSARQRVIAAAVQPKGSAATTSANADDDFETGFRSG